MSTNRCFAKDVNQAGLIRAKSPAVAAKSRVARAKSRVAGAKSRVAGAKSPSFRAKRFAAGAKRSVTGANSPGCRAGSLFLAVLAFEFNHGVNEIPSAKFILPALANQKVPRKPTPAPKKIKPPKTDARLHE